MKRKFLLLALALIFVSSASAELAYDSIKLMEYKEWVNDKSAEYEMDEEGFIVDDVEGTTRSGVPFVISKWNPVTGQIRTSAGEEGEFYHSNDNFSVYSTAKSSQPITGIIFITSDSVKPENVRLGTIANYPIFEYENSATAERDSSGWWLLYWAFEPEDNIRQFHITFSKAEKPVQVPYLLLSYGKKKWYHGRRPILPPPPPCMNCPEKGGDDKTGDKEREEDNRTGVTTNTGVACAICGYEVGPAYMKSLLEPLTKQELAYVNQKFGEEVANFCDIWSTNIPAIKKNERKECLDVLRGMTYCDYLEYSHSWWEVLAMNAAFSSMQKSETEGVAKLLPKTDPPVLLVLKEKFLELYKPSEPADKVVEQLVMYHFTLKFSKVLHQYDLEKYVYDVYEDD